ncbi:MAG: GNAT family N-acetyltransferase [Myxococcales bacterium]|nr:GNAT family N-acetyltransferase [Myxococcales bacterium]
MADPRGPGPGEPAGRAVRTWLDLDAGRRATLAAWLQRFDPVRFVDADAAREACGSAAFERGANHLSVWGADGPLGALAVVTREVAPRGLAFVTGVCVEPGERAVFDRLLAAAIERVGDAGARLKLAVSPERPHLADWVARHGFVYREDARRLALTGPEPSLDPHPRLTCQAVRPDEVETYRAVAEDCFRAAPNGGSVSLDEAHERLAGRSFPDQVALYRLGDAVVGFHELALRRAVGNIDSLGLLPRFQGRGLGAHVLRGCVDTLRAHGAQRVELLVMSSNRPAVRLYARHGFTLRAVLARWFERPPLRSQ